MRFISRCNPWQCNSPFIYSYTEKLSEVPDGVRLSKVLARTLEVKTVNRSSKNGTTKQQLPLKQAVGFRSQTFTSLLLVPQSQSQ